MRKRISVLLTLMLLFLNSVSVLAAPTELPINHSNKYVYSVTGGDIRVYCTFHREL